MWITNGIVDDDGTPADVVWLYARTGTDERGRAEITTFLVEKGMGGILCRPEDRGQAGHEGQHYRRTSVRGLRGTSG